MKRFAKDQRSFFNLGFKFCIQFADGKCYFFKLVFLFNQTFFSFLPLGNINNKCYYVKMIPLFKETKTDFNGEFNPKAISGEQITSLAHFPVTRLLIKAFTKC